MGYLNTREEFAKALGDRDVPEKARLHDLPDDKLADALFPRFAGDGALMGESAEFFVGILQSGLISDAAMDAKRYAG